MYDEEEVGINGPDTPTTFTPRGPSKGFIFDQLDAFQHMQDLGCDFLDALRACLTGKRMTPDLASKCIATYWRRYYSLANFQESRGAAITLQAAMRRMRASRAYEEELAVTYQQQASTQLEESTRHIRQYRAAQQLQTVWRGHLARTYVAKLKYKKQSRLQRTFSWSNKSKRPGAAKGKDPFKQKSAKDILAAAGVEEQSKPKPVRRSMSFDRFSRGVSAISSSFGSKKDGEAKPEPAPTMSKQLLFILLHRGPNGLGLELDATNTVVNMVPGGAAETQGYFKEGDTIASVDGIPLRGRLLQDVMDRSKNSYSFDVWRLSRVEPDPPAPKVDKPVRRAFSFDRKRR